MNVKVEKAGGVARLLIEGDMTIYHAGELKKSIFENLSGCEAIEFDLKGVSGMDTAGVQLLALARREADAVHKPMRIIAPSDAAKNVFDLYNLKVFFK